MHRINLPGYHNCIGMLLLAISLAVHVVQAALVLDCGLAVLEPSPDYRVQGFATLSSIATDSVRGLGIICVAPGRASATTIQVLEPRGALWYAPSAQIAMLRTPQRLVSTISHVCFCVDIAPETPEQVIEGPQPELDAEISDTEESAAQGPGANTAEANTADYLFESRNLGGHLLDTTYCSEYWFGRPAPSDCNDALTTLENMCTYWRTYSSENGGEVVDEEDLADDELDPMDRVRFVGADLPTTPWPEDPSIPVQGTPLRLTNGTCTIEFSFEEPHYDAVVNAWEPVVDMDDLIYDCVEVKGIGGEFFFNEPEKLKYAVYGPTAKFKVLEEMKIAMKVQKQGGAIGTSLEADPNPPKKKQKTLPESPPQLVKAIDEVCLATDTQQCNIPCYRHEDCSLENDYLCALKGDIDVPIDPSWGRFECVWVANAAIVVAAAMKYSTCSTGRCLLEADGSLFIPSSVNDIIEPSYNNSNLHKPASTNLTNLLNITQLLEIPANDSLSTFYQHNLTDYPHPQTNTSKIKDEPEFFNKSLPQAADAWPEYNFNYTLFCPCNCTYVSEACCTSQIVHEDVKFKINMTSSPLGLGLHCDSTSGDWVSPSNTTISSSPSSGTANTVPLGEQSASNTPQGLNLPTVTKAAAQSSASSASSHHMCYGQCLSAARSCAFGYTRDCKCGAPVLSVIFWHTWPCVATDSNPIKEFDPSRSDPLTAPNDDKGRKKSRRDSPATGPVIDPTRVPGVCNDSYISYACADAEDGIVHEPLRNWLGALLPADARSYPPVPQEFMTIHGIKEQPDWQSV